MADNPQGDWARCAKCQTAFFTRKTSDSECAAGGRHEADGTCRYSLPYGVTPKKGEVAVHHACRDCYSLIRPGGSSDVCESSPSDQHRPFSNPYVIAASGTNDPADTTGGWDHCVNCASVFFVPNMATSRCTASGGEHEPPKAVGTFRLTHDPKSDCSGGLGGTTVCVTVLDCDGKPLTNAKVEAYNAYTESPVDVVAGAKPSGVTNAAGTWCVDVVNDAGLYFRVKHPSCAIKETPPRGFLSDRVIKPNEGLDISLTCCATSVLSPFWSNIGVFKLGHDIGANGLTVDEVDGVADTGFAWFGILPLRGQVPATVGNSPVSYRFVWTPDGAGSGTPITKDLVAPTTIGTLPTTYNNMQVQQEIKVMGAIPAPPTANPNALLPPPKVIAPDKTTGWIEIPPGLDIGQLMLRFDTRQLPPWHGKKFAPPKATCGKAPSKPKDGIAGVLTFEARTQGNPPFATNSQRLVINNWNSVQRLQITPTPCDPVTDELDVCFTFDHQFPRHWDLVVDSPKSKHGWQHGSAPAMGPRGAAGTIAVHDPAQKPNSKLGKLVPDWDPCVYRATLSVVRKLTNGYYEDSRQDSYIDFCKCQH